MVTTLQWYDETNSVVLFDLNDPTGANASDTGYTATYLGSNLDLGSPSFEFERFNPPQSDGGSTTFKRAGMRQLTIPLMIVASTYDNYKTAVGRLAQLCYSGGVLKWIPDGSAVTEYIDVEPSPTPFYLDGRQVSLYEAVRLFGRGSGITLSLTAQPYLRGAELDSATNLFTNATMLRDADGAGRPDGWSWSSASNITNEAISATSEAFQFDIATAAQRSLTESTAAASAAVGETWTLSGYARVTATSATTFCEPMLTWRTSAPADISTITGTLTNLTTTWQRLSVSGVAPATTDRIQAGPRMDNTAATSATVQFKNWQIEKQSAATPFHVGSEAGTLNVAPSSGMGRIFPIFNPGDAPAPVSLVFGSSSGTVTNSVGVATNGPRAGTLASFLNGASISQSEAWTPGTDTATDSNASSSPGSSTTGLLTTFVTTTLASRGTATISTAATLNAWRNRTFRLVLRFAARTAAYNGVISVDIGVPGASTQTLATTITAAGSGSYYEVELGTVNFPDSIGTSITIGASASRTSGTGNLVWDYLAFIPLEHRGLVTGYTVTSANLLKSLPEESRWAAVNSSDQQILTSVAPVAKGEVIGYVPPGLSLIDFNNASTDQTGVVTSTTGYSSGAITVTTTMRVVIAPRYLT